jgi:hypothetical protein
LLSFDPDLIQIDNYFLEAEFRFLGSLVAAGCDFHFLKRLLVGLDKPYQYDLNRIYYDWTSREWKDLPEVRNPYEVTYDFIKYLEGKRDYSNLKAIHDQVKEALMSLKDLNAEDFENKYDFDPSKSFILRSAKVMLR